MRLFIAIRFDEPFKKAVLDYQQALRHSAASGNFTRPENLHLTLAFIGEVRDSSAALRAVKSVTFDPFTMTLGKCGRFGNLCWLGVESGKQTEALAQRVRSALAKEGVPFDTKPFKAHITVAREVESAENGEKITVPDTSMTVSRIALMKSERINGKLIYSEIR